MLPTNAYFDSMSLCYNICLEKKGNPVIVRTTLYVWKCYHMVRSVTKKKKKKKKKKKPIEHTSLFIFDLAIRHTVFVSA